jgi:hypothetical protein
MIKIDYPQHAFRFKSENDNEMIFDELRKSWLRLTPEEWVRQNFVQFLVSKKYPAALIALEKKIMVGEMMKRFDILVFDRQHEPLMMVECKAMNVVLGEEVLRQVLRYHVAVPVSFLVITNGTYCMAFKKEERELVALDEFPDFVF